MSLCSKLLALLWQADHFIEVFEEVSQLALFIGRFQTQNLTDPCLKRLQILRPLGRNLIIWLDPVEQ